MTTEFAEGWPVWLFLAVAFGALLGAWWEKQVLKERIKVAPLRGRPGWTVVRFGPLAALRHNRRDAEAVADQVRRTIEGSPEGKGT